jgi:hypothetical protein
MRAAEVKRSQAGADDGVAELLHRGKVPAGSRCYREVSDQPLNKRLAMRAEAA